MRPIFKAIMPIFQAEILEKVKFSLIRFYFLSPVKFLDKNMAYYYIFLLPFQRNNIKSRPKHGQGVLSAVLPRPAGGELLDSGSGNISCTIVSGVNFPVPGVFSVPGVLLIMSGTLRSCPKSIRSCPESIRSCPEILQSCPENIYSCLENI